MIEVVIHPMDLRTSDLPVLEELFNTHYSRFLAQGKYELTIGNLEYKVLLTHPLLRNYSDADDNMDVYSIEVLDPHSLTNFNSKVLESLGTLDPNNNYQFSEASETNNVWVKVIPSTETSNDAEVYREHRYSQRNLKLQVKPLISDITANYIVMTKPIGCTLNSILDQVRRNTIKLGMDDLIELTTAIFRAFKSQVADLQLIHNNINGDNIYVDLETMEVTFVNYEDAIEFSSINSNTSSRFKGGNYFFAPELYLGKPPNKKSDLYSLGLTVAEIWGDESTHYYPTTDGSAEQHLENLTNRRWKNLFRNMGLAKGMQNDFLMILNRLVSLEASNRTTIQVILNCWLEIVQRYNQDISPYFIEELAGLSWSKNKSTMFAIYTHQEPPYQDPPSYNPLKSTSF
ncbi:MAG: hypothetical protein EPN84_03155 [Legionella sp.]|nr:MAG: hypothetical protein EPN84_03155 [Legionella sp.]